MSGQTERTIAQLDEAIRVNGLRLTEINNKIQAVNRGGVYRLGQPVCAYIARQMGKRDAARELQTILHSARKQLRNAASHIEHKSVHVDFDSMLEWGRGFEALGHNSESGK